MSRIRFYALGGQGNGDIQAPVDAYRGKIRQ